ncbi:MAG: J domain-containing protein [Actinomycetota bacterium]
MSPDLTAALAVLGLAADADIDDVRAAHRRLAKAHHPDVGGRAASMGRINDAVALVLASIAERPEPAGSRDDTAAPPTARRGYTGGASQRITQWVRDAPSFVVEALPVDAFEALVLVAAAHGEIVDDEPPYRLDAQVRVLRSDGTEQEPIEVDVWCRLELVPDAGSSTVSLVVGCGDTGQSADDADHFVEAMRDWWIAALNELEWRD